MAIRGNLGDASLPDVIQLLALGRKTGCLTLRDRHRFGYIFFDSGTISFASVIGRRDRLGDQLRKNGLVTEDELAQGLRIQRADPTRRIGTILAQMGAISRRTLEEWIRRYVEESIYHLFTWREGSFVFTPDQRPVEGETLLRIDAESVLLEGARRVDEWALIETAIPSLDVVFAWTSPPEEADLDALTAERRRIQSRIDGRRSVREISEETGLGEFAVARALFELIRAGSLREVGRKAPPPEEETIPSAIEGHRNLGLAFYRTRTLAEAEREFQDVLKLCPGDPAARFYLALIEMRSGRERSAIRRLRTLIEEGEAVGAAFHNLALALERMGRLEDALLALGRAQEVLGASPVVSLSRAVLLTKAHRMWEAAELFGAYRSVMGEGHRAPAVYYAFAMIAEGACRRLDLAENLAEEAVRLYPRNARVLLHAGAVSERAGDLEQAEARYRRAVEADPVSALCRRALADALYQREAWAAAAAEYREVLARETSPSDDLVCRLAHLRYKLGDRPEALRLWRHALELNPLNEAARTNIELVERSAGGASG